MLAESHPDMPTRARLFRWLALVAAAMTVVVGLFLWKTTKVSIIFDETSTVTRPRESQQHSSSIPLNLTALFLEEWCNLKGAEWYPTGNDTSWQQRAPYFLLAGAKKAGTTSLAKYLIRHPLIAPPRTKELRFFLPTMFPDDVLLDKRGRTLVAQARHAMYYESTDYPNDRLRNDASLISFDATPGYVFYSSLIAPHVLCTCPWTKMLLILRDPVDRVWSHYHFFKSRGVNVPSFERFVESDMETLRQAGMLNDGTTLLDDATSSFAGSEEEFDAWTTYLQRTSDGPLGRGMYEVQLRHWYDAFREIGRDPETEIFLVRSEDLNADPNATLNRIFQWLDLPEMANVPFQSHSMVSRYEQAEMDPATRRLLQDFYRPYNRRFYNMMGGDWVGIWDPPAADEEVPADEEDHVNDDDDDDDSVNDNADDDASNLGVIPDSIPLNMTQSDAFVHEHCKLQGWDWFPSGRYSWQLRAPYFMLPGAKRSGTTSLSHYLMQHPFVTPARTKHFFLNKNFRARFFVTEDRKSLVGSARAEMYPKEYNAALLRQNDTLVSFDATPGYLFFSTVLPERILCVCPWIKLVVILRHPVERAYSNYAYAMRRTGRNVSFEQWMEPDFNAMKEAGLIHDDPDKQRALVGTPEEDDAWTRYLTLAQEGPIGRSLYEIQLRHWYRAFRSMGRDPETQILIVQTEELRAHPDDMYQKVLTFLDLPYHRLQATMEANYTAPIKQETRAMLNHFFAPHNKRLYELLGSDWEGRWDQASNR